MYCIYCGKHISEDSIFCCYCGKEQTLIDYNDYYYPKDYIITENELKLYKILLEIAKELNLILLCQVSLYSIIQTKYRNDKYFNKIKSKSIDFVLIKKENGKIELCIELDDSTHNYESRIERDKFINKLFNDLRINLLRIKTQKQYNRNELENLISSYIKE